MEFRILELFSGIGGMNLAFHYSQLPGKIEAAYDINHVANLVYAFNHPEINIKNNNIQILSSATIEKLGVNMILMSPPCQPHTRVGKKGDLEDNRSDGLQHICKLLPECTGIQFVLMENVKGFEKSQACKNFLNALKNSGFNYCELILSPTQFGVPNTRHRYYCLARKNVEFSLPVDKILEELPIKDAHFEKISLQQIIEPDTCIPASLYVQDKDLLKRVHLMDIVTCDDVNTMCFTKAYTRYAEGTGSVFTTLKREEVDTIFKNFKLLESNETEFNDAHRVDLLRSLHLRYFTPREVARLMSFPEYFNFPLHITDRQKYRLLGNSINILVVGELIKLLCT